MGDHSTTVEISIDGIKETYSERETNSVVKNQYATVLFEKRNLSNVEHTVVITNKANASFCIDAIDIDLIGALKPYNESISSILLDKSTMNLQ